MSSKLYISLLTIFAVGTLLATSDTPSSSSSSSLTANMSDATESTRTKRKGIDAAILDDIDNEEESSVRQKALRMGRTPSTLTLPESLDPTSPSPSPNMTSSRAPLAVPKDTGKKFFPAQFYSSPFLRPSFEYLDFIDLSVARKISKSFTAFKDMASEVLMPSAQQWVALFRQKFDGAKTGSQQNQVFRDMIPMVARCPNAIVKLREIINNYYQDVPKKLRLWNLNAKGKLLVDKRKNDARTNLCTVAEDIAKIKAEQQSQESGNNKELVTLKAKKKRLVKRLLPCLHALAPYTTASIILSELGDQSGFPENLPPMPPHKHQLNERVLQILAKKFSARGLVISIAAGCLPSVHAALATQLDTLSRSLRPKLELRLMQPITERPRGSLSPDIMIRNDQQDISYYNLKINQLREAIDRKILIHKQISRRDLENALLQIESDRLFFVRHRTVPYLKLLENPAQAQRDTIIKHVMWLMETALDITCTSELADCRSIANSGCSFIWNTFINSLPEIEMMKLRNRIADVAAKAVTMAGSSLRADDLRHAACSHIYAYRYKEAADYYDHLLTEFSLEPNFRLGVHLDAGLAHAILAAESSDFDKNEIAKSHFNTAWQYLMSIDQKHDLSKMSAAVLKSCLASCEDYSVLATRFPPATGLAALVQNFTAEIKVTLRTKELEMDNQRPAESSQH